MNKSVDVRVVNTAKASDLLLTESLRANRDLKVQSKEDFMLVVQSLKDKNQELKFAKQENQALFAQVESQQEEFLKFRNALKELRARAKEGSLTYDVLYGPEISSFNRQIEKLKNANIEGRNKILKLDGHCQAMSVQIIDKQKRINQLEARLLASEERKTYIESLIRNKVKPVSSEDDSTAHDNLNVRDWFKNISESAQDLLGNIHGWLKA
jgi:predicted  nucleic acid-binding Zn-ribbon protein